jgi:hypothetical protein
MKFTITNRTDKPIYVNWANSNFNYKGTEFLYSSDTAFGSKDILKEKETAQSCNEEAVTSGYFVSSRSNLPLALTIPPKTEIVVDKFKINQPFVKCGYYPGDIDTTNYTRDNSILHFSNCLTYSLDKDLKNPKYIDNDFWVNSLVTVNGAYYENPASQTGGFYIKKKHKTQRTVLVLAAAAVIFTGAFILI